MPKKPDLRRSLSKVKASKPAPTAKPTADASASRSPGRRGQFSIGGWFSEDVKLNLEEIRLTRRRQLGRAVTQQEILNEMFNDFFIKEGYDPIIQS